MHKDKPSNELSRLIAAYRNSLAGLHSAWGEAAFRTEIILAVILLPLACMIAETGVQLALLLGSLWLVLIVELLNTGIEKTIDRVSSEWHELAKYAKDVGSAAVLLSIANLVTVWLAILCL